MQVLRQGLTYLNVTRSGRRRAEDAARVVDQIGGPDRLVHDVARRELTLRSLQPERRLALEMAVDERAEVQELERQWREAEEIAEIADGTLSTSEQVEEELRRPSETEPGRSTVRLNFGLPQPPGGHYLRCSMAAPLVQITLPPPASEPQRKPPWLKVKAPGGATYVAVKHMMRDLKLHTVCEEAHCPNIGECWEHKAATFMILGDVCTRNCAYCAVAHGTPVALDVGEPVRLAEAVAQMGLRHVVITSVDRDDLPNGGAEIFAACIVEIRRRLPETSIEVLIPDFKGNPTALRIVVDAKPDILNHNLETIERLYRIARPGGRYPRALELLRRAKELDAGLLTKSGIICGLGEDWDELLGAMRDVRGQGVDILTLGQYLRPSDQHLPIARWYTPDEFAELKRFGLALGYRHVESGPLVRSSYHAWEQVEAARA